MQRVVVVVVSVFVASVLVCLPGCPRSTGNGDGAGEGEGEGEEGVGEGEGEGEGEEGEGDVGEGEGEGEGNEGEGEGEGEGAVGEGEGEGDNGGVCARDGDCGGADVCLFAVRGELIFDGDCGPAPSGTAPGQGCTAGADQCARGVCLSNLCTQLCVENADCPGGMACASRSFTNDDGVGGAAGVCIADTTLAETPCSRDADCTSTGRLCNSLNASFQLFCGFAGGGNAFAGSCASEFFESRDQCQTGLCDGETAGMCTRACVDNGDCGGDFLCSGSPFENVSGDYCAERCVTDEQCNSVAGRFCSPRDSAAGNAIDLVCVPPLGAGAFGAAAASGLDCNTGLQFDGKCTRLCASPGTTTGCAAPLPDCTSVIFQRPGGGGDQPLNLCLP